MTTPHPDVPKTEQSTDQPVAGAPSDNTTLSAVLASLEQSGYGAQLIPHEEGDVTCAACGSRAAAGALAVEESRRLEGASDPDDMVRVVAVLCPSCGVGGTLVLGFGANASPADAAVGASLRQPPEAVTHVPGQSKSG